MAAVSTVKDSSGNITLSNSLSSVAIGADTIVLKPGRAALELNLTSGTWSATIALQYSDDSGSTWYTHSTYTAQPDPQKTLEVSAGGRMWRFNCTVWVSGTILCVLKQSQNELLS